jgi:hypothetical protein
VPNQLPSTIQDRFWSKVDRSGDCWLWTAYLLKGYGQFWDGTALVYAHRFAYELLVGPILIDPASEDSLQLDHRTTCPKKCVNPEHLRPVPVKQNAENRAGAQINSKTGIRGVYWHKQARKWTAQVGHNGKSYHVGLFKTIEEAEVAVIAKRNELFTHNDLDRSS